MVTDVPPAVVPLFGTHARHRRRHNVGETARQTPALATLTVTVTVTAPALPAGVVAVMVVLFTTATFVAAVLPNVTVAPAAKFVPVIVTAVPPAVVPLSAHTRHRRRRSGAPAENVTICITHGPAPFKVAVAVLLPAVVTILSSAISPSGEVMIREVKPLPAAAVCVPPCPPRRSTHWRWWWSPRRCLALRCSRSLRPSHPASSLPYIPESEYPEMPPPALNVTVTVLLPPSMFAA